jgi:hypothetical protein
VQATGHVAGFFDVPSRVLPPFRWGYTDEESEPMRKVTKLLIASSVATATVVWSLWSPFSPASVNVVIRDEPEIIPVSIASWLVQFSVVMLCIKWIERSA